MDATDEAIAAWFSKDPKPFKQGAEACLYRCIYFGRKAVIKERSSKIYRYERKRKYVFYQINFSTLIVCCTNFCLENEIEFNVKNLLFFPNILAFLHQI